MGSTSASSKPLKRKVSASAIIGFFTRQSSAAVSITAASKSSGLDTVKEAGEDHLHGLISAKTVHAPPYINPLGHRLLPRTEDSCVKRPASSTSSQDPPSGITKARHRGMAQRQLNGDSPPGHSSPDEEDLKMEELLLDVVDSRPMGDATQGSCCSLSIEAIAENTAKDELSAELWKQFLKCYSSGNYNVNNLPRPPPCKSGFGYLPAPRPYNEDKRLEMCKAMLSFGLSWNKDRIYTLIRSAKSHFNAKQASLSFFNPDYELFFTDTKYETETLHRQISIGSHALLTPDVLVLVDTLKDWRFKNSPVTRNMSRMRFWAGAPMLSSEGVPLGVFAIWGRQPRDEFSPTQRRDLAAYSALFLEELLIQAKNSRNPNSLSALSQSTSGGLERRRSVDSEVLGYHGDNAELFPSALRLSKEKNHNHKSRIKAHGASDNSFNGHGIDTPPSSAECDKGPQFEDFQSFGNSREERSSALTPSQDVLYQDTLVRDSLAQDLPARYSSTTEQISPADCSGIESPGCGGFNPISTRPYSSASDLSSFHQQPPNSPVNIQSVGELSREPNLDIGLADFLGANEELSEESREISEGQTCPLAYQPSETDQHSHTDRQVNDSHEQDFAQRVFPSSAPCVHPQDVAQSTSEDLHSNDYDHSLSRTPLTADSDPAESAKTRHKPGLALPGFSKSDNARQQYQNREIPRITISNTRDTIESPSQRPSKLLSSAYSENQLKPTPDHRSQVALALCEFAQSNHYDLMYVAEVKPTVPFSTDAMLFARDGLQRQVLAAFGMERRMSVNARLHIETLRTRGFHSYFAKGGSPETGAMIAVCAGPGPLEKRSAGMVLGAFRMSGKRAINRDESARLKIFAEEIKSVIKQQRGIPKSATDPGFEAFPAKEAIEVKFPNHLYDTTRPWR